MNKLEKLLYRKQSLEFSIAKFEKGARIYDQYCQYLTSQIKLLPDGSLDKLKYEKELIENELQGRNYITGFREMRREYKDYIIPEFIRIKDEYSKSETEKVQFEDMNKKIDELIKYSVYGKASKEPANIEHHKIIKDFQKRIDIVRAFINAAQNKVASEEMSEYERFKLEKEIFDSHLELQNLEKRLNDREDYYNNQFLPTYKKDMQDCDKYLSAYLDRAKEIIRLGVDPKLDALLHQYKENEKDKEKTWLFYIAIRERVNKIMKDMRRNKHLYNGKMHLSKKIS